MDYFFHVADIICLVWKILNATHNENMDNINCGTIIEREIKKERFKNLECKI